MERIKSILQLRLEQEKLAHRRLLLEEDLRRDWKGLLHSFKPGAFARDALFSGLTWIGNHFFASRKHSENKHPRI